MASHQNIDYVCFSRGGQLFADLSWHCNVALLPRSICDTWKDGHVHRAKQASQILLYQRLKGVCTSIYVCACMYERDRAGQGSHYCILNVILDGFCTNDDECAAFPLASLLAKSTLDLTNHCKQNAEVKLFLLSQLSLHNLRDRQRWTLFTRLYLGVLISVQHNW